MPCETKPEMPVCRGASVPYLKIKTPFFCPLVFFKEYIKLQINISKMVNAHTEDYNPCPSRLTSRRYIPVY